MSRSIEEACFPRKTVRPLIFAATMFSIVIAAAQAQAQVTPARTPYRIPGEENERCLPYTSGRPQDVPKNFTSSIADLTDCITKLKNELAPASGKATLQAAMQQVQAAAQQAQTALKQAQDALQKAQDVLQQVPPAQQAPAKPPQAAAKQPDETAIHDNLFAFYLAYENVQLWFKKLIKPSADDAPTPAQIAELRQTYGELATVLHDQLDAHALLQPFAANLVTGFVFGTTGAQTAIADPSKAQAADTGKAQAVGYVKWESLHFWARPHGLTDLSISGTDGFLPILVLVQQPSTASGSSGSTPAGPLATFQQAFVWSSRLNFNIRLGDRGEAAVTAGGGQSVLTSLDSLLGTSSASSSSTTSVVTAAANNTGRSEGFYELGGAFALYSDSIQIVHVSRGSFAPTLLVEGGWRKDYRFKAEGILQPGTGFTDPDQRLYVRFVLQPVQLLGTSGADKQALTFGFEVDYQKAVHSGALTVPSGNRILFRADLNLFKATQGTK